MSMQRLPSCVIFAANSTAEHLGDAAFQFDMTIERRHRAVLAETSRTMKYFRARRMVKLIDAIAFRVVSLPEAEIYEGILVWGWGG